MRKSYLLSGAALVCFTLLFIERSEAQFSFGFYAGAVTSADKHDVYALNRPWPPVTGPTNNYRLMFFEGCTGTSLMGTVTWDVAPHFGLTLIYRNTNFSMTENKRSATSSALGVQGKVNFARNTSRVVPFLQAEYYFFLKNSLHQENAVSTYSADQVQPGFDKTFTANLGIGGDLGLEIKVTERINLVVLGGYHGIAYASHNEDRAFVQTLDYGNYWAPSDFDGIFFLQFSGGLKYYLDNDR